MKRLIRTRDRKEKFSKDFLDFAIQGLIFGLASIVIKAVFPASSDLSLNTIAYLLVIILGTMFLKYKKSGTATQWKFYVTLTTLAAIVFLSTAGWKYITKHTDYIVLDVSENSKDNFRELRAKLLLYLNDGMIPSNTEFGFAVYGSGIKGKFGCSDIEELVESSPKNKSIPQITNAVDLLVDVEPSGPENIQGAMLFALERLRGRYGVQRIILITSGLDQSCSTLNRGELDQFAKENDINFKLNIMTIGELDESLKTRLQEYASDNALIAVENLDEVPKGIEFIVNSPPVSYDVYYFGYYGYLPSP